MEAGSSKLNSRRSDVGPRKPGQTRSLLSCLRLPFGTYTGVEILDTLEVLGHERYEELLKKAGVLNEQFVDWRTRSVLKPDQSGQLVPVTEQTRVEVPLIPPPDDVAVAGAAGA